MVPQAKGNGNAVSPESKEEEEAGIGVVQSERSLMLSLAWTGPWGRSRGNFIAGGAYIFPAQLSCHPDRKTELKVWRRCINLHVLRVMCV